MRSVFISIVRVFFFLLLPCSFTTLAQQDFSVRDNYKKMEVTISMRDGTKLFTSIYLPKDDSQKYPILLNRTPYSVSPYGAEAYRESLGPSSYFPPEKYIFVYQDVRGRLMSEGDFKMMTPFKTEKKSSSDVDESTDTYDTIEWLLKNIPNNNGKVGIWGISYPGFYTAAAVMQAHPAIKAASPQAPMADTFIGDDFHHNGAFFLPHAFNFLASFGKPRTGPTTAFPPRFEHGTPDGYRFFLELGTLGNANKRYFHNEIAIWNEYMKHGNYDEYWQAQNVLPHLKNVKPAIMVVGGWFDSEDLYGPLSIYKTIEKNNPNTYNIIVMGPWVHGGWARTDGDQLGNIHFGTKTSFYYRRDIELAFFNHFLKDKGELKLPEAVVFETGSNQWRSYDHWPPVNVKEKSLYFHEKSRLSFEAPKQTTPAFDEYISDPNKPVPFTAEIRNSMGSNFMVEDQRFAWTRPDVVSYETEVLSEDVTLAGPIKASLYVSTTGTDSDFIVKVIDVLPDDTPDPNPNPSNVRMGGFQMLTRAEVMRAKYRNSYSNPEPMKPGQVTKVEFELRDVNHCFKKGHKIMVQVQSSWFPLVDRNPQKFVDIYNATENDFQKATQRIYRDQRHSSCLKVLVLE